MITIDSRKRKLIEKLKNKKYRDSFVSSGIDVGIAFQIRALRKQLNYTQEKLAEKTKMKQEAISALENPSHAPNISTLIRLANSLEIGLVVRFVSIGELVERHLRLSPELLEVLSFNKDPYFFKEEEREKVDISDSGQYIGAIPPGTSNKVINMRDHNLKTVSSDVENTLSAKTLVGEIEAA